MNDIKKVYKNIYCVQFNFPFFVLKQKVKRPFLQSSFLASVSYRSIRAQVFHSKSD